MIHKPLKGSHFSRYTMGFVFLGCGLLFSLLHLLAGSVFLILAFVILYYAPRWNLKIETTENGILFSENVVDTQPVNLGFSEILEIRRMEEKETRKGLLNTFPSSHHFVEFVTQSGKVFRMHDIFGINLDNEIERMGRVAGINLANFARKDLEDPV